MLSPFLVSSPKIPYNFPPPSASQLIHFCFLALEFHYTEAYNLHKTKASPPTDGWLGHPLLHTQLETWDLEVLVSSYCCSSYKVADPFSSLDTFSSSLIGSPVFHPIDDCEHQLLYLPGTGIASQEIAISGSCQQNLASICNSVWV